MSTKIKINNFNEVEIKFDELNNAISKSLDELKVSIENNLKLCYYIINLYKN